MSGGMWVVIGFTVLLPYAFVAAYGIVGLFMFLKSLLRN